MTSSSSLHSCIYCRVFIRSTRSHSLSATRSLLHDPCHSLSFPTLQRRRRTMATSTGVKRDSSHLSSSTAKDSAKKPRADASITSFFGFPKSNASTTTTTSSSFNKAKWVSSLTAEQKELLKLEIDTLDESWLSHLKDELVTREFLNLKRFLKKQKDSGAKIFPPEKDIYSWSRHTPFHKVKAVIIGQDPYHNNGQAHGLCFSVQPPTPAPPSLRNIYTAIKNDYPSFKPPPNGYGLLTPWAEQGVLMLNTCLTVQAHEANSHSQKGWERFTQKAIEAVSKLRKNGVVFLAWGSPAAKRISSVNREKHCVLQAVHPSPLSAHRGFMTCGHFKKTNEWLQNRYGEDGIIDWDLSPKPTAITVSKTINAVTTTSSQEGGDSKTVVTALVSKTTSDMVDNSASAETADDSSDYGQDLESEIEDNK